MNTGNVITDKNMSLKYSLFNFICSLSLSSVIQLLYEKY